MVKVGVNHSHFKLQIELIAGQVAAKTGMLMDMAL
jgi:hypothetical protein